MEDQTVRPTAHPERIDRPASVGNRDQAPASGLALRLNGVTKRFRTPSGGIYTAVEDIDLDVAAGTFVSIVGPSGSGKSTILNMTAGLTEPSAGTVEVFGEPLRGLNRRATYMFQQDALLPWKTVLENAMLGLIFRGVDRREARERALYWLEKVGLKPFADRYPYQLSGGMRKRVAVAQSWIVDPDILHMDEPFSALDVQTRQMMENELLELWASSRKTVLFVTHDLEEAIALSDEVVVLSAGPGSRIVGRFKVDIPRPRNLIDIRAEPAFGELYRSIWAILREEVLKSYERHKSLARA
ncbi:MAG: ABC transporter ATP-binding protein [Hydrogenibacillus sp.]|nr:ABC transporter ATP-binding protein [Hydrogenibacillus sp.]